MRIDETEDEEIHVATEVEAKTLAELVAIGAGSVDDPNWDVPADLLAEQLRELGRANARDNADSETTRFGRKKSVLLAGDGDDDSPIRGANRFGRRTGVVLPNN